MNNDEIPETNEKLLKIIIAFCVSLNVFVLYFEQNVQCAGGRQVCSRLCAHAAYVNIAKMH